MGRTAFVEGQTVLANSSAQGLVAGGEYQVVEVLERATFAGNFVTYVLEREGQRLAIGNGHLLLSGGAS